MSKPSCSPYVTWQPDGKSARLNLAQLHPALAKLEFERGWREWKGAVSIDGKTYTAIGRNRFEALAELLNLPELLEQLKDGKGRGAK